MNKLKNILFLLFAATCCIINANAQDIHFSQFQNAPLTLNPALTGIIGSNKNGNFRAVLNHRCQWNSIASPFVTSSVSADYGTLEGKLKGDILGLGLLIFNDKTGENGLSRLQIMPGFSYIKAFDRWQNKLLSVGFQTGFFQKKIDANKLTFASQFYGQDFYSNIPSGEAIYDNNIIKFDLNAGINYCYTIPKKYKMRTGLALFHLNRPNESFLEQNIYKLPVKTVLYWRCNYYLENNFLVIPSVLFMKQKNSREFNFGAIIEKNLNSDIILSSIYVGTEYRIADAFVLMTGIRYNEWQMNFSYDINTSSLHNATNYKGAFEISITYIGWILTGINRLSYPMPCMTF